MLIYSVVFFKQKTAYEMRISDWSSDVCSSDLEPVQGQRYLPGQQFKPHNDWFYTTEKYWQLERKRGGQRSWTAMAFLNQVEEGGETHFTNVGIQIEPKPGVLMVWNNALPDGTPNEGTMHAGTPVVRGAKYAIGRENV